MAHYLECTVRGVEKMKGCVLFDGSTGSIYRWTCYNWMGNDKLKDKLKFKHKLATVPCLSNAVSIQFAILAQCFLSNVFVVFILIISKW